MLHRKFGKTGWDVSAIGLGCWNIGNQWGEMDDDTATGIVHAALDNGINLFDVAESYGIPNGTSEMRLGRALKGKRDDVFIISKIGHWGKRTGQEVPKTTADMIRACGHACCGRLQTDRVDVMLCHDAGIEDPSVYIEGFRQLRDEGFIREYGISTNNVTVLKRFNDMSDGECAVVEYDHSLLNQQPEEGLLPYCEQNQIAGLVRGPVAKGLLSGKYDRETVFTDTVRTNWNKGGKNREDLEAKLDKVEKIAEIVGKENLIPVALQYVISQPADPVAIPGATSTAQAAANAAAGAGLLDQETLEKLKGLA